MKKMTKAMLMTALILGSVQWGGTTVHAEELHEFTLDPMVVTASRMEKRDLDTAAAVDVITSEMVERNGGASAYEVLRQSLGLTVTSQGPNGVSYGSMTSEVTIRGVERGTLVLLDGVPLNQDGKYNLEDIPSDIIDRIEIVRSGGSVLYGSDASGGVVNIITKKGAANKVKFAVGDLGREQYSALVGSDKFTVNAYYENRGEIDKTSTISKYSDVYKYYKYNDGERKGIRWNVDLNDKLTFRHQYSENENSVSQVAAMGGYNNGIVQTNDYTDTDNHFTLNFDDEAGFKIVASYGTQEKEYYQTKYGVNGISSNGKSLYSWREGHNTNIDLNKTFEIGDNKFLIGASYKKEDMDYLSTTSRNGSYKGAATYDRDVYSVYASYDWKVSDSDNVIVNARQTFAKNCGADYKGNRDSEKQEDCNEFTPEIQYLKKINENSSVYVKAGESFRLPDLTRIFGTGVITPTYDLYPEEGKHYEIGYKLNDENKAWRIALFKYRIKNSIESIGSIQGEDLKYVNADTKNTGVELTCDIEHDDNWNSSWGITYSKPKKKGDYNDDWVKYQDGFQFTASIDYHKDKFAGTVLANYLANRYDNDSEKHPGYKVKPALYTDLHLSYTPEKNQKVFLHLNNLLDREDYTTNCAPLDEGRWGYITVGFNFMLGYEYSF